MFEGIFKIIRFSTFFPASKVLPQVTLFNYDQVLLPCLCLHEPSLRTPGLLRQSLQLKVFAHCYGYSVGKEE